MNPDCRDGKHTICNGDGYDEAADQVIQDGCPCKCHRKEFTR